MSGEQPTDMQPLYAEGDWVSYREEGVAVEVLMDLGQGLLRVRTDTSERTIRKDSVRPATEAEEQAAVERRVRAGSHLHLGRRLRPHP